MIKDNPVLCDYEPFEVMGCHECPLERLYGPLRDSNCAEWLRAHNLDCPNKSNYAEAVKITTEQEATAE